MGYPRSEGWAPGGGASPSSPPWPLAAPAGRLLGGLGQARPDWYINPDTGGQAAVAETCSTDQYTITTQVLPQDASQQRDPAGPPARGAGLGHRPDEHRPAVHRGVRQRRLPRPDPATTRRPTLKQQSFKGAIDGRDLERQAGRLPVLVQHPGALVPQVLRPEGRPRHDPAGHLGPDHQGRRRQRRHGRRAGQQVRGLRRLDQRPRSRAPAAAWSPTRGQGRRRHDRRSTPRPGEDAAKVIEDAGPLQGRARRPVGRPTRARPARPSARPTGAFMVNWTYICHNYDADPARRRQGHRLRARTPRPSRARRRGRRTAASASASARTPTTWTSRLQGGDVHHVSPRTRAVNADDDRQHAGQRSRLRSTRRCRSSTPPTCSSCSRRASTRPRPRSVTPYWSDISGAHPEHLAPADQRQRRHPADVARRSSSTSCKGRSCCDAPRRNADHRRRRAGQAARQRPGQSPRTGSASKLVAPAVIMMLLVTAYPMLQALYLSLFRYRLTTPDDKGFVGLGNYGTVLTDSLFWKDTCQHRDHHGGDGRRSSWSSASPSRW